MAKRAYALALRYGQAVFEIAEAEDAFDSWPKDLQLMAQVVADRDILFFLESPKVSLDGKRQVLAGQLKAVKPEVVNLVLSLASRNQLGILPDIISDFQRRLDDKMGVAHAAVASAVPLSQKELDNIREKLGEMFGRKVEVTARVDESLLGGIVARVGDKVIDGSLSRRLRILKQEINQARL
ncbi:ATP synthase F1, delta subunit [Dehalogenimonas lykanthroporepellens BL-DC-9]|nr:ATP synthase F1, delta subunit [Dehalogenimonas lykanthroporepellens BL-DC-9]